MTLAQVKKLLSEQRSWQAATPRMQGYFAKDMQDKLYGFDEIHTAWVWFAFGWYAKSQELLR